MKRQYRHKKKWKDRKDSAAETNKSAITDHVAKENHVTDWSGDKILDTESHHKTRQLNLSAYGKRPPTV